MKMYAIQFAPDGKHFQNIAKNKDVGKLWNRFNCDKNITIQKKINKFSKFRLINLKENKVIGEK
jgi:hypothetical protein